MEKVELSSDWLTGCGAPLPEGGGGRRGEEGDDRAKAEDVRSSCSLFLCGRRRKRCTGRMGSHRRPQLVTPGGADRKYKYIRVPGNDDVSFLVFCDDT